MKHQNDNARHLAEKGAALSRRAFLAPLVLGAAGLGLTACGNLLPGQGPPLALYRLSPKSTFSDGLPQVDWQLVLETPTSNAALNTTRIALQRDPMQIEYYARAGWADRAPTMLQTLMLESFENSGRIVSVGRENVGLRSDFVLSSELREFEAIYGNSGPPEVLVSIILKLVKMPQRAIIGHAKFSHSSLATGDSLEAVVKAFDIALGKVLKRVVEWTLEVGRQAETGS